MGLVGCRHGLADNAWGQGHCDGQPQTGTVCVCVFRSMNCSCAQMHIIESIIESRRIHLMDIIESIMESRRIELYI